MLEIRQLSPADVPHALRLSTQAGWNQLPADWQRLLGLWPDTCLAGWKDGRLVATATLATYERSIGWVGMVLVDEQCRRRGFGGAMLDAVIGLGEARGIAALALDASDEGRPVYLKRGFVDVAGIARWSGVSSAKAEPLPPGHDIREISASDWPEILARDLAAGRADRSALLRQLASEPEALSLLLRQDENLAAFGFARSGRTAEFLGPIWAANPSAAQVLHGALLNEITPRRVAVIIDLPSGSWLEEPLRRRDFRPQRKLMRMIRPLRGGAVCPLCSEHLPAAAGFELG